MEVTVSSQTRSLEELKHVPLGEIISQVLNRWETWTIRVSNDQEVSIQPKARLKPLPTLEGYIPKGWKDAIYG